MVTNRIFIILVYLLRLTLLTAALAGLALLNLMPLPALALQPVNAGFDPPATGADANNPAATSYSHSILGLSQAQCLFMDAWSGNPTPQIWVSGEDDTTPLWMPKSSVLAWRAFSSLRAIHFFT